MEKVVNSGRSESRCSGAVFQHTVIKMRIKITASKTGLSKP